MNKQIKKYLDDYFSDIDNYYDDFLEIFRENVVIASKNYGQELYEQVTGIQLNDGLGRILIISFRSMLIEKYIKKTNCKIEGDLGEQFNEYFNKSDHEGEDMFMSELAEKCYVK